MGYVDKATQELLGSLLFVNFKTQPGAKIADITHADTDEHTLTTSALGLPSNVVAIYCTFTRISGSGTFRPVTAAAGQRMTVGSGFSALWPIDDTGVFRYALGAANDDWDIFCHAYITQGRPVG